MEQDVLFMKRCLELAANGLGSTYPNPMVGSVIVHEGNIIGEGWHQKAGHPHAEVNAIQSVKDKSLLKKSTIYVSLEPCSHFGKTPPCAHLILEHKIPRVVVGVKDPYDKVAGKGIEILKNGGCDVSVEVLEKECYELNKRFFTFHQKKRPYIILKWAQSKDGYIAPLSKIEKKPVWISNERSRQLVHKWRTEEQAILVGTHTVLDDNPRLDARDWNGHQPTRIIIDRENSIPEHYHCKDHSINTLIFTEKNQESISKHLKYHTIDFTKNTIPQMLKVMYDDGIQSLIVEGGLKTLQSFIDASTWDEARIFEGNNSLGEGIPAPLFTKNAKTTSETTISKDTLKIILNHD
ncbi:MAG: bifunctional diaminohydroxyphosphoribosylaminopyrimidine deaminase/5-amino-6-(5-phosphoribosylamino)uracil reductase RibD [Flavobacterium sp.]